MRLAFLAAIGLGLTALCATPVRAQAPAPMILLLSAFDGTPADGAVIEGSSWFGNVTQNSDSITVGGFAGGDNGWLSHHLSLDATGMNFINITAQRDPGHEAGSIFLQFEDKQASFATIIFAIDTDDFAVGSATEVSIPIDSWLDFDYTQIGSWSLGGGGVGTEPFRMTFYNVQFSSSGVLPPPVPEPAETVALAGGTALGVAAWRRRKFKDTR